MAANQAKLWVSFPRRIVVQIEKASKANLLTPWQPAVRVLLRKKQEAKGGRPEPSRILYLSLKKPLC